MLRRIEATIQRQESIMAKIKYTNENISDYIKKERPEYTYIDGEVKNVLSKIRVKHDKCNNIYTVIIKGFFSDDIKGYCKLCNPVKTFSRKGKLTEKDIKKRFTDNFPNGEYKYISGFLNTKSKMKILHKECNTYFNASSHMFFGMKKSRCPNCANKKRSEIQIKLQGKEDYLQKILLDNNIEKEYYWIDEYSGNNKNKHLIFHKVCGERSLIRPNDVQQGYLPCACEGSKYEVRFKNLLKNAGITFEREFKIGKGFRVDFVLTHKITNLPIFIEIDGELHYSDSKIKERDIYKDKFINSTFPESDFYRIPYNENFEEIVNELKEIAI
jgi:hypothetical protein